MVLRLFTTPEKNSYMRSFLNENFRIFVTNCGWHGGKYAPSLSLACKMEVDDKSNKGMEVSEWRRYDATRHERHDSEN